MTAPSISPYDRLPNETTKAWAAFCVYRDMGIDRSHEKVRQHYGRSTDRYFGVWSSKYKWVQRCKIFDDDEFNKQGIASRKQRLERRLKMEEAAWKKSEKFYKKSNTILDFPIVRAVSTPDGKTTYNPTDKWSLRDAIALDEHAHKLAIFATGGETPNISELDAIKILVQTGMLPVEVLDAAEQGIDALRSRILQVFQDLNKPLQNDAV